MLHVKDQEGLDEFVHEASGHYVHVTFFSYGAVRHYNIYMYLWLTALPHEGKLVHCKTV